MAYRLCLLKGSRPGRCKWWKTVVILCTGLISLAMAIAMAHVPVPERLLMAYREYIHSYQAFPPVELDPQTHLGIPGGLPPLPAKFKPWVTYEKLSRVLEEKFWKARNVGCGRVLVHTTRHNAGFGSQFNNMLLGVAEALAANRTFVLGADVLDGGYQCKGGAAASAYQTCFNWTFIGPPSCDGEELRAVAHGETWRLPIDDVNCQDYLHCAETEETRIQESVRTPDNMEIIRTNSLRRTREGGKGPLIGGKELDWLAFKAYSTLKLWVFTPETQTRVDRRLRTMEIWSLGDNNHSKQLSARGLVPPRPLCSIHVRRGDKIGTEATEVPISKYVDAFRDMDVHCQSYHLASDDIGDSKSQLTEELRRRHFLRENAPLIVTLDYSQGDPYASEGYHWGSFLSKPQDGRVENTIDLLAEFEIMRSADAFVGAYSSNVARLAMVLRAATGWGPETSRSVEGKEWNWL